MSSLQIWKLGVMGELHQVMKIMNHVAFDDLQETTITEIKQKIMKIPDANGIVIDGFPRDVGQALSFEDQVSLIYPLMHECPTYFTLWARPVKLLFLAV